MKSKILSSNSILMKYFTGTVFWMTFAYTLVMFILVPVALFIYSKSNELPFGPMFDSSTDNILMTNGGFQLTVSMVFAAIVAVMLFNFKNKEASSDYIHALPIKRGNIFINAITVGFLSILIPLVIMGMIVLIMVPFLSFQLTTSNIFEWLLFTLIVQSIIFTFSLFVGLLVNRINLHIEMIVIFLFLPLTIIVFIILAAAFFFNGISTDMFLNTKNIPQIAFPVFAIEQMISPDYEIPKIVLWLICAGVLFISSYFLYKYRRNERVNEVFNFSALYHIIVVLLTLLGMLILGLIFTVLLPIGLWINILMFGLGALISYLLAMMFMQDSVRIHFNAKNIIMTFFSIALFWAIFIIGWNAYVNYVPKEADILAVKVVDFNSGMPVYQDSEAEKYMKPGYGYSQNKTDIAKTINLHKSLTKGPKIYSTDETIGMLEVHYLTKDNKKIVREFKQTSESIKTVKSQLKKIESTALTAKSDFLYNLKEDIKFEPDSLHLFYYFDDGEEWSLPSKKIEAFQRDYVAEYSTLKEMNQAAVKYTGKLSVEVVPKDNYVNLMGISSIYNPAVANFLKNEKMALTKILNLDQEYMALYKIDLSKVEDKTTLYNDLNYLSSQDLQQKYDVMLLEGKEHNQAMKQLNDFNFDTNGATLLLVADKTALEKDNEYPIPFTMNVMVR